MSIDFKPSHDLLETDDRDRALSLAFAPAEARDDLAALFAFNIETSRIRNRISEPMPGEIRLQWWRDALAGEGEGAAGHPIGEAFADVIARRRLPHDAIDRMLEARIFDLYDDPMPSRMAFEAYAGETASTLIMLAAMILDPAAAPRLSDAAGHAGVAETVADTLRALPLHRQRGQVYIPADLLSAAGCTPEDVVKGKAEPSGRAIAAMIAFGREHVAAFRKAFDAVPKSVRAAFLPARLAAPTLDAAVKAGTAILDRPIEIGPLRKTFRYWRTMRT